MCPQRMVRLFFKDSTHMDVEAGSAEARYYESDPAWDHTEELDPEEVDLDAMDAADMSSMDPEEDDREEANDDFPTS